MPYHMHLNGTKMEIRDSIVQLIRPQTEKKRENLGEVPPLLPCSNTRTVRTYQPKFEYTVRSNSDPAKRSTLQGPGCRTEHGLIVKCGSKDSFRTQRQPSQLRSGSGGARLSQSRRIFHIACINRVLLQFLQFLQLFIAAMRKEFTVQSGMFIAGEEPRGRSHGGSRDRNFRLVHQGVLDLEQHSHLKK